mmetsp:Transcript_28473/g.67782  ORF Transcript_28473/g.67782 Transcript_28473/m.67782 type:complete len:678 (-) Transcript_28473:710-2743(-)
MQELGPRHVQVPPLPTVEVERQVLERGEREEVPEGAREVARPSVGRRPEAEASPELPRRQQADVHRAVRLDIGGLSARSCRREGEVVVGRERVPEERLADADDHRPPKREVDVGVVQVGLVLGALLAEDKLHHRLLRGVLFGSHGRQEDGVLCVREHVVELHRPHPEGDVGEGVLRAEAGRVAEMDAVRGEEHELLRGVVHDADVHRVELERQVDPRGPLVEAPAEADVVAGPRVWEHGQELRPAAAPDGACSDKLAADEDAAARHRVRGLTRLPEGDLQGRRRPCRGQRRQAARARVARHQRPAVPRRELFGRVRLLLLQEEAVRGLGRTWAAGVVPRRHNPVSPRLGVLQPELRELDLPALRPDRVERDGHGGPRVGELPGLAAGPGSAEEQRARGAVLDGGGRVRADAVEHEVDRVEALHRRAHPHHERLLVRVALLHVPVGARAEADGRAGEGAPQLGGARERAAAVKAAEACGAVRRRMALSRRQGEAHLRVLEAGVPELDGAAGRRVDCRCRIDELHADRLLPAALCPVHRHGDGAGRELELPDVVRGPNRKGALDLLLLLLVLRPGAAPLGRLPVGAAPELAAAREHVLEPGPELALDTLAPARAAALARAGGGRGSPAPLPVQPRSPRAHRARRRAGVEALQQLEVRPGEVGNHDVGLDPDDLRAAKGA